MANGVTATPTGYIINGAPTGNMTSATAQLGYVSMPMCWFLFVNICLMCIFLCGRVRVIFSFVLSLLNSSASAGSSLPVYRTMFSSSTTTTNSLPLVCSCFSRNFPRNERTNERMSDNHDPWQSTSLISSDWKSLNSSTLFSLSFYCWWKWISGRLCNWFIRKNELLSIERRIVWSSTSLFDCWCRRTTSTFVHFDDHNSCACHA